NTYQTPTNKIIRIADIGTGSGFLGIAVAWHLSQKFPESAIEVTLADISEKVLAVAQRNAEKMLTERSQISYVLVQSDLLENISTQKFDVILSNLPYIPSARIPTLDASVLDFEPHLAL